MTAGEVVARVKDLPPASDAANRLVHLLGQPMVSNEEIARVLRCDGVLTAKLLRVCNSSFLALRQRVSSVDQAVLILGYEEIFRLVMTLVHGKAMAVALPGYAVEANELWRHSLATAIAAEVVADADLGFREGASVAFTAGLLHDIGKIVLGQVLTPDVQTAIRERIQSGRASRVEAEREVLGTDHAEVGAHLLGMWKLPEAIVEAVANHHQPVLDPRPRMSVVAHLADCLAHLAGSSPGWEAYAVRVVPAVVERLQLDESRLEGLVIAVRDCSARMERFLSVT